MNEMMMKLYVKMHTLLAAEEGQDLVEYALIVALLALAAVVSMQTLAGDISQAFTTIGGKVTSSLGS